MAYTSPSFPALCEVSTTPSKQRKVARYISRYSYLPMFLPTSIDNNMLSSSLAYSEPPGPLT